MATAETRGKEGKPPPALPAMNAQQEERKEAIDRLTERGQEEYRREPSVWHSNPLGLAETLKRREEMKKMADNSHKVAMERRSLEHPHIEVQGKVEEGKVCITVPKDILDRNSSLWKFALVGRFTGPRPELERIRQWAALRWRVIGLEIIALPKGSVLFNFPNQEDMLKVLLKTPWYMDGKGLLLEKWHKDYNPKNKVSQMIPLWVNIPNLPLQSWDKDVIRSIANAIGKIIAIDSATTNRTRLIQARFCVLVRMDKAVPTKVELEMEGERWTQDLIYETSSIRCFKCKRGGHLPQNCNQEAEEEHRPEINKEDNKETEDNEQVKEEEEEEGSGEESSGKEDIQEDPDTEEQQTKAGKETEIGNKEDDESQEDKTEEEDQDKKQEQEQEKEEQQEGGNKQEGENSEPEQAEEEPEEEPEAPRMEKQKEQVTEQVEPEEEEYDEEHAKWLRKQQKKAKQREKWRRENEELREGIRRYHTRNSYYRGYYDRRPGRPTNQESREREAQREIEQGKQKTLEG